MAAMKTKTNTQVIISEFFIPMNGIYHIRLLCLLLPPTILYFTKPPGGLGCCPFWGGGSVVVDFLFIVAPIVGVCNCSMFCCT